jgi:hypothetical protein
VHARFSDHAGLTKCSRWRSWTYCLPLHGQCRHPGDHFSIAAQWLACTFPADASPTSSRMPAHGLGPMWVATPSSQWTCTTYSLPVSRRTRVKRRSPTIIEQFTVAARATA